MGTIKTRKLHKPVVGILPKTLAESDLRKLQHDRACVGCGFHVCASTTEYCDPPYRAPVVAPAEPISAPAAPPASEEPRVYRFVLRNGRATEITVPELPGWEFQEESLHAGTEHWVHTSGAAVARKISESRWIFKYDHDVHEVVQNVSHRVRELVMAQALGWRFDTAHQAWICAAGLGVGIDAKVKLIGAEYTLSVYSARRGSYSHSTHPTIVHAIHTARAIASLSPK